MEESLVLTLQSDGMDLKSAGGKGLNLARLARAGLRVPQAVILTTTAYKTYVERNNLKRLIDKQLDLNTDMDPLSLQGASEAIRAGFSAGDMPPAIRAAIGQMLQTLGDRPLAVRSSATAEDLPDASFAGQQDTFLNVIGENQLLQAIIDCWSSLWTARAISYRSRNRILHDEVALGVVIQETIPAEVSGVMFTANPLTGNRNESVIDATFGLGEALVSGAVEPDHYVIDHLEHTIVGLALGSKQVAARSRSGGGILMEEADAAAKRALSEAHILELTGVGQKISQHFGSPQDIEWALSQDEFFILQSRPITSLFPIPEDLDAEGLQVFFSFASVQGIFEPITPLGQDVIRLLSAGLASLFGFEETHESQRVIYSAGERLWVDFSAALRHPIGKRLFPRFFSAIDPGIVPYFESIQDEIVLANGHERPRFSSVFSVARFAAQLLPAILANLWNPDGKAVHIQQHADEQIRSLQAEADEISQEEAGLSERLSLLHSLYNAFPYVVPKFAPALAAGLLPLRILHQIAYKLTCSNDLALEITRGMPHNVTTEMDLVLWDVAKAIRADNISSQKLLQSEADVLASEFLDGSLPPVVADSVAGFMRRYGMRGVGEIDFGRPRWREDPVSVMQTLQSYLQIEASRAPDVIFREGAVAAQEAVRDLQSAAAEKFPGRLRARFIGWLAVRVHAYAGLRESPKFHIVKRMGIARKALLEAGEALVAEGIIKSDDDLFYLYLDELDSLAAGEKLDWGRRIADRRGVYERELSRRQVPRLLLSDGRFFYDGPAIEGEDEATLKGSPVSPGTAEGQVRVVHEPAEANLQPGEILVCVGTDPAWTPLFLAAGGLVMEVGGVMTHGAIVAREYGIPAVVGVREATHRLENGQRVRVDGSSGKVFLLEAANHGQN